MPPEGGTPNNSLFPLCVLCGKSSRERASRKTMLRFNHHRGSGSADRFAVFAGCRGGANAAHFIDHSQTVAAVIPGRVQGASGAVVPSHRNLTQAQLGQLRQINQFNIETEAIDLRGFDQWPANIHAKSFESTMSVPERQARRHAHNQIKYAAALFAPPRLMHANQTPIERARAESKIAFIVANWI